MSGGNPAETRIRAPGEPATAILQAIRGAAGLLGHSLRSFALVYLGVNLALALLLAAGSFTIASRGSPVRGALAAAISLALALSLGLVASLQATALLAIERVMRQLALGRTVLDVLFQQVLGVTAEVPAGTRSLTRSVHGLPASELETRLERAARDLLSRRGGEARAPGPLPWLASRLHRIVVRAAVQAVASWCTKQGSGSEPINLLELQNRLAGQIDGLILRQLRAHVVRLAVAVAGIAAGVSALLALALRQLPF